MLMPSGFEPDKEQRRKIRTFSGLLADGKELFYEPFPDILYADLNGPLTDKHLAICMLRHLDKEIGEKAERIMETDRPKRSKVFSIAKLVKGKTLSELHNASTEAEHEVDVPIYIKGELKILKPTRLKIWTNTPRQTVDIYVGKKIEPLYNYDGEIEYIVIHATELQHINGVLTGGIESLPDDYFRAEVKHSDYMNALRKVSDRIV